MKKIIIVLMLAIFLAGCQFERKETLRLPEVSFGTQGVEPFFEKGIIPVEVFEESTFPVLITLLNLGTSDVDDGYYSLSYEQQQLYLQGQGQGRFRVRGKSIFNPTGEARQLTFVFNTKPLGAQIERYSASITFNACYPYLTTAPLTICVDTDILGQESGKVCEPATQTFPKGQGAPITIASVETRMLPHEDVNRVRPEFILTLRNQGSGEALATQLFREACTGRPLGADSWNMISVQAALSDLRLTCTPTPVKLRQKGETRVVCTIPEGIDSRLGTYTEQLEVTLDYGYLTSISTQVQIVKPLY